jgi:hypothetical protein
MPSYAAMRQRHGCPNCERWLYVEILLQMLDMLALFILRVPELGICDKLFQKGRQVAKIFCPSAIFEGIDILCKIFAGVVE